LISGGLLKPSSDDFAMLRLVLLAILPADWRHSLDESESQMKS